MYRPREPEDEVVISGIAGKYPSCENMEELKDKIMDKQNLITKCTRWPEGFFNLPTCAGEVPNIDKFDAPFFGIHAKQVGTMDPSGRLLLECTYEAIVDAGYNITEISGKNIAVVTGSCYGESERLMLEDRSEDTRGFIVTGSSKAMLANRISYWLDVHGPSICLDTACSSSCTALDYCYRMLLNGECDAAVVAAGNLCIHPYITMHFANLGVLAADGCCRPFDVDAKGYVRSDGVCVVFLQRAKNARRLYATLVHSKANSDGYKKDGITYPSNRMQTELLKQFYDDCGIPPTAVNYVEAHGTGTKVGDPQELMAIDTVLAKGRSTPLKIGSVKSNLGHTEPTSGFCSISKVIIAMETGIIPPNINYTQPRHNLTAIIEGRLQVVTEKTPWELGYAAVNNFGFGGANVHVLLKSNPKEKVNNGAPNDDLPRLVAVSGRTLDAVHILLNSVEKSGVDVEYIRLLHEVHALNIPRHGYRGYAVVGAKHTTVKIREVTPYDENPRPIWFIFSGMGSQWPGMGKMLMKYPVFAEAIKKCDAALRPRGIDIVDIISSQDPTIFDNILHCFVGIAAVQIGLVDLLTAVGIVPDKIMGHSVGELGCAYADGCFTAEQMILSAYARGLASIETELIHGAMAAIGLGAKEVEKMCPADIDVACHNSSTSSTISGPVESIKKFVAELTERKVFAKMVASGNIAYHSRYIAKAAPQLLSSLRKIIPEPKLRSGKWLSSSVLEKDWNTEASKYSSAEYHTNNLLSAVFFEETAKHVPKNAITIEIAPHGLLQAILKRSFGPETSNIPLTLRDHKDNSAFFAQALGKLYNVGLQPKIANIYPPVSFPVSRGTPMIAPHIKWDHSREWFIPYFDDKEKMSSGERTFEVSTRDAQFEFMSGHVIDGRNLLPATGYLWLVWETYAQMTSTQSKLLSIVFENVHFLRATTIQADGLRKRLVVMLNKGTGYFEIIDKDTAVVTGKVHATKNPASEMAKDTFLPQLSGEEVLDSDDIYKEFKIRGYEYEGLFQSLISATSDGTKGHIAWRGNYVPFLDNMLQLKLVGVPNRYLYVPTGIRKIVINVDMHNKAIASMPVDKKDLPVYVYEDLDLIASGGVQIFGAYVRSIPRKKMGGNPVLEEYKFVAHRDRAQVSVKEMLIMACDLAFEVQPVRNCKALQVVDSRDDISQINLASSMLVDILMDVPLVQPIVYLSLPKEKCNTFQLSPEIQIIDPAALPGDGSVFLAVGENLLTKGKEQQLKQILPSVRPGGFILTTEDLMNDETLHQASNLSLHIVIEKCNKKQTLLLLRKDMKEPEQPDIVSVTSKGLDWVGKIQEVMKRNAEKQGSKQLILVSQADRESGILGMVNCLRKEPGGQIVRTVIIDDENSPKFVPDNPLYAKQLQLNLPINVLRDGLWGSYRHLPLQPLKEVSVFHAFVDQTIPGDLSSFKWIQGHLTPTYRPDKRINVMYVALNFKDIMLATGRIPKEVTTTRKHGMASSNIGFEYSGVRANGDRIMGFTDLDGITNLLNPVLGLFWTIRDDWSLEDAATVPTVYATACYAFYVMDHIKKGETILIHSGTGGVGQAAIHFALQEGLEVFTTVGSAEKRRFIRERYPSIPDDHIGNSRDTSFEQMIMQQTNGRGVDIVLNSLTEDKLLASVRCLARRGRFLEIGKYDIAADNTLNMLVFLKEISFRAIMLDSIIAHIDSKATMELKRIFQEFIDQGKIQPISRKVFRKDEVETAMRYMSSGNHIGKMLIKVRDENGAFNKPINAYPRFYCKESANYVIIGGLGGLGLEVAEWLYSRGAQNLVLVSRRGVRTGYQKCKIDRWRSEGVNVTVITGKDCSKQKDCEYVLKAAMKVAPVDAIFNLAVQLKDALFTEQTVEAFEEALKPKVGITKQLDELSRTHCPDLSHFVVFSSVACGRGNPGQSNYGYANAVMERICERRVAEGLPGLAIQWGAVGEVGLVATMLKGKQNISIAGTLQQKVCSCMEEMERFLLQSHPVVCSMVAAEKQKGVSAAHTPLEAVLHLMSIKNVESVNKNMPLVELGMDSILGIEIKDVLERNFDVILTTSDIRNLTLNTLIDLSTDKNSAISKLKTEKTTTEVADLDMNDLVGAATFVTRMNMYTRKFSASMEFPVSSDRSCTKLFLITGMQGYYDPLIPVLNELKYSATCLQYPPSAECRTILALAEYLLPHITRKLSGVCDIVLVGYSFGTLVTVELARMLEKLGHNIRIILIEGTPFLMTRMLRRVFNNHSESQAHDKTLKDIAITYFPSAKPEWLTMFEKFEKLSDKVDFFTSKINVPNVPEELQKGIWSAICARVYAAATYQFDESLPLKSPITFLKAVSGGWVNCADGCHGLETVTKGEIGEMSIAGNHMTILDNKEISTIINSTMADV